MNDEHCCIFQECAICLESLSTPSDYDNNPSADVQCVSADTLQLLKCKHMFHRICLQRLYESGTSQVSQVGEVAYVMGRVC